MLDQKQVNTVGDVTTTDVPGVAALLTTTTLEPTWSSWRGAVSPPPTIGTVAIVVGTHVVTPLLTGTIKGAEEGPTVRNDGTTATTVPFCEQMVAWACAGTNIGAVGDPTAR